MPNIIETRGNLCKELGPSVENPTRILLQQIGTVNTLLTNTSLAWTTGVGLCRFSVILL